MITIEDIIKLIEREGIVRIKGALSALGYLVYEESPAPVAPDAALSIGSIHVCTPTGVPIVGHSISIETVVGDSPTTFNDTEYYASLIKGLYQVVTDENGKASIPLLKGLTVRVYLEGSALYREIIVPDNDFNLLDSSISTSPDAFSSPVTAPKLVIRGDL